MYLYLLLYACIRRIHASVLIYFIYTYSLDSPPLSRGACSRHRPVSCRHGLCREEALSTELSAKMLMKGKVWSCGSDFFFNSSSRAWAMHSAQGYCSRHKFCVVSLVCAESLQLWLSAHLTARPTAVRARLVRHELGSVPKAAAASS
jgi:hypothetical protein